MKNDGRITCLECNLVTKKIKLIKYHDPFYTQDPSDPLDPGKSLNSSDPMNLGRVWISLDPPQIRPMPFPSSES